MNTVMKLFRYSVVLALLVVGVGATQASQPVQPAPVDVYQDIPPGFDFPADEATLLRFRDTQDVAEMRRHGWYVWAGLTQPAPGGEAIWETWYSIPETFTAPAGPEEVVERGVQREFTIPRQFIEDPDAPEAIGESLLSAVLFNASARRHIQNNDLYLGSTLTAVEQQLTAAGAPTEDRQILDFERDAVALKAVWWLVKEEGLTALPVWDFTPVNPDEDGNPVPTWSRVVAVDPSRDAIPAGETATVPFGANDMSDSRVVPLESLYHFQIETQEQLDSISSVLGPAADVGDYVALVALHFTTKEIEDWVWGTFWWHDKPDEGPFALDRPSAVTGVWRNYLMDVAYSMQTPREFDGTPNSVYNPWLEARFRNGMVSNCMTCHQRAVWRNGGPVSFMPVTVGGLAPDDEYFEDALQLDFLWSIGYESQ